MKNKKQQSDAPYVTLALAEKDKIEKNTKTGIPSDIQVENARDFSIENKK